MSVLRTWDGFMVCTDAQIQSSLDIWKHRAFFSIDACWSVANVPTASWTLGPFHSLIHWLCRTWPPFDARTQCEYWISRTSKYQTFSYLSLCSWKICAVWPAFLWDTSIVRRLCRGQVYYRPRIFHKNRCHGMQPMMHLPFRQPTNNTIITHLHAINTVYILFWYFPNFLWLRQYNSYWLVPCIWVG